MFLASPLLFFFCLFDTFSLKTLQGYVHTTASIFRHFTHFFALGIHALLAPAPTSATHSDAWYYSSPLRYYLHVRPPSLSPTRAAFVAAMQEYMPTFYIASRGSVLPVFDEEKNGRVSI